MDAQTPKRLVKIRTFAQDIEKARQKSGVAIPEDEKNRLLPKTATPSTPTVVETSQKAVTSQSEHIPAFHELQKKNSTNSTLKGPNISVGGVTKTATPAPKRTVSVRAKKQDLKAVKNVGGGTIITDSKAEGFKLIPSIVKSIDDWIKGIKKTFKRKTAPKYVITDTERRRGVIQKATSKTGSIFTADNETLKEEIRRRQQNAATTDDIDINWSPNTEAGYPLLESGLPKPVTTNVTVAFKKQSTPTPPPTPTIAAVPTPPVTKAVVPPPVIIEPTTIAPIVPEPAPVLVETPTIQEESVEVLEEVTEPEEIETPIEEPSVEEYELTTPEEHYKIRSLGDIARINTNILSIGIIGAIAGLIIFIVIVRTLLSFITPDQATIVIEPPAPLAKTTAVHDASVETLSRESLITAAETTPSSDGLSEFRFVDSDGVPLTMDVLLPILGFETNANLNRAITDVRLVIRGQERGLVFTVTDSTTAFGSLLSSEKTLVGDLSETLGINTADTSGSFSDTSLGGTDVRVYTTDLGQQLLVYGFITENTVVITSNSSFFTTILGSQ